MRIVKIMVILVVLCLLSGCIKDKSYNKAKCGDDIYDIKSITRWSDSNYKLTLKSGEIIEVHPVNCKFYNE